ncbi:hypothetical protein K7G98_43685, partial [Saccharothrix sp. MB29]|nr:hypothetical protein [Saccharothrix sp. MB29]
VAVTTFNTLGSLDGIDGAGIAMLVVDEAHYVKNPAAQRTRHVAALPAPCRLCPVSVVCLAISLSQLICTLAGHTTRK